MKLTILEQQEPQAKERLFRDLHAGEIFFRNGRVLIKLEWKNLEAPSLGTAVNLADGHVIDVDQIAPCELLEAVLRYTPARIL